MQAAIIILVFVLTYIGMAAGRLPWLQVDRTGIALLGVILLLVSLAIVVAYNRILTHLSGEQGMA